ncbi:MAG: SDR family oxidoreductase, partial [Solirubrobacteraceae bacterium]
MRIAVAGGTGTVGRHAVTAAEANGHDVRVLSRSRGVDARSGEGLADALDGVDAIIDATKSESLDEGPAAEFFRTVAGNLAREGAARGVGHIVTLSIVGIDNVPFGVNGAQLAREQVARDGAVPSTIMRATQFHEFPAQMIVASRQGDRARLFDVQVQTVAARTVGQVLVEL